MFFTVRAWGRYKYRASFVGSRGSTIIRPLTRPRFAARAHHHTNINPSPPPPPPPQNNAPFWRIPHRLQRYVSRLKHAPVKSITAFLILHELTAVVPFGLVWWGVRTLDLIPVADQGGVLSNDKGADGAGPWWEIHRVWHRWVEQGVEAWGSKTSGKSYLDKLDAKQAAKALLELGTAWAVVKVLFPLRIMACLWATPWFARAVVGRVSGAAERVKKAVLRR